MIPSDIAERRKMIEYMIEGCCNFFDEKLSTWEQEFIISIHGQFKTKQNLSDRQCEILEKIYTKVTS